MRKRSNKSACGRRGVFPPLRGIPRHFLPRKYMYVQMKHALPRVVALVYDQAVSAAEAEFFAELRNGLKTMRKLPFVLLRHFRKQFEMVFRYAEIMLFRLGIDVLNDHHHIVLIDLFGGDFPFSYFAEYAIHNYPPIFFRRAPRRDAFSLL